SFCFFSAKPLKISSSDKKNLILHDFSIESSIHPPINKMRLKQILSLAIFLVFSQPAMAQWKLNDTKPVVVCDAINFQSAVLYSTDDEANSYYIWADYRTGSIELYVQKFNSRGVAQWQKNGVRIGMILDTYANVFTQK